MFSLRLLAILTAVAMSASTAPTDKTWTASCAAHATSSSALGDSCVGKACAFKFIAQTKHPDPLLLRSTAHDNENGSGSGGGGGNGDTIHDTTKTNTGNTNTYTNSNNTSSNSTATLRRRPWTARLPNARLHGRAYTASLDQDKQFTPTNYCLPKIQPSTRPSLGSAARPFIFNSSFASTELSGGGSGSSASAQPTEPPSHLDPLTPTPPLPAKAAPVPSPTTATLNTTKSPQGQHGNATAATVDGETPNAGLHGRAYTASLDQDKQFTYTLYCLPKIQPSTRPLPGSAAQLSIFTSSVLSRRLRDRLRRFGCGSGSRRNLTTVLRAWASGVQAAALRRALHHVHA